jgi:hypothetical protein
MPLWGTQYESHPGNHFGCFELRMNNGGEVLRIIASESHPIVPWDHVSVSTHTRVPTWEEMCFVKELFFEDDEAVMQLHPPKKDYVNHHPHCLHLWRPTHTEIPLPSTLLVAPRNAEEEAQSDELNRQLSEAIRASR